MNKNVIFWLGILGAVFFIITTILGGFLFENYNHIKQFISESYAIGTKYGMHLRIFGFIPSGIFITLFAFFAFKVLPKSKLSTIGIIGFGLFYGISTIMVSIFPCDVGCNKEYIDPSVSQLIHNLFGAFVYLITPICLILIGLKAKKWRDGEKISITSILCGGISALFVIIFINGIEGNYIGLYQRIIEALILFWMVKLAFYIKHYKQY